MYGLDFPIDCGIFSGEDADHLLAESIGCCLRGWARKYHDF